MSLGRSFFCFLVCLCVVGRWASATLSFLVVGDWGGSPTPPYYTDGQKASAVAMENVAADISSNFVLAVGDNFYLTGIQEDEHSARFQDSFENVYSGSHLQTPWLVCPGNHDYMGNVTAEVAYSSHSQRWIFPSLYHSKSFQSNDGVSIDVILIDTVTLTASEDNRIANEDHPDYFKPLKEVSKVESDDVQWAWLESAMAASTAQYLIVAGHHPVYSVCDHGPTATLVTNLAPLLSKYGAHYVAGHDHCSAHFVDTTTNYIQQGMGDYCCYRATNLNHPSIPKGATSWYVAKDNASRSISAGFSSVVATAQGMTVKYFDQDGHVLFTAPSFPPRKLQH